MAGISHFVQLENFPSTLLPELRKPLQVISVWMILHNFNCINMRSLILRQANVEGLRKVRLAVAASGVLSFFPRRYRGAEISKAKQVNGKDEPNDRISPATTRDILLIQKTYLFTSTNTGIAPMQTMAGVLAKAEG